VELRFMEDHCASPPPAPPAQGSSTSLPAPLRALPPSGLGEGCLADSIACYWRTATSPTAAAPRGRLRPQLEDGCSRSFLFRAPRPTVRLNPRVCTYGTNMAWPSRAGPQGRPHYCLRRPAPPVARTPPAAGPASPFRTRPSRSGPRLASPSGPLPGPLRRRPPRSRSRVPVASSPPGPLWVTPGWAPVPRRAPPLRDCGFAYATVEALYRA
jgi:hypothetical protein